MSIYDDAKQIVGVIQQSDNVELLQKFASFQTDVFSFIEKNHQLIEENARLRKEIQELKESLQTSQSLVFKDNLYRTASGDGPFCPGCWDSGKKQIRLISRDGGDSKYWVCPICKFTE